MERHETTAPWPKMDRSNARTMELFRRLGVADEKKPLADLLKPTGEADAA